MAVGIVLITRLEKLCRASLLVVLLTSTTSALPSQHPSKKTSTAPTQSTTTAATIGTSTTETSAPPTPATQLAQLQTQLRSIEADERFVALNRLVLGGYPQANETINQMLNDPDWIVQGRALQLISTLDVKERQPFLVVLSQAMQDPQWYVRGSAVLAIANILAEQQASEREFKQTCFAPLVALRLDNEPLVRRQTVNALSAARYPDSVAYIAPLLTDEETSVVWAAALALADLGDRQAIVPLEAARQLRPENQAIYQTALYQFGDLRGFSGLVDQLNSANTPWQRPLILALCRANDERAVNPLIEKLKNDLTARPRDEELILAIVSALGRLQTTQVIEPLTSLLKEDNLELNLAAIQALATTNNEHVVPLLIRQFSPENPPQVNQALSEAIAHFEKIATVDALIAAYKESQQPQVRVSISNTLEKMGITVDKLSQAIKTGKTPSWQTPRAIARWLPALGVNASFEPLVDALNHPDEQVRTEAAQALGKIGDRTAIEPLLFKLEDSDPVVRNASIEALQRLGMNSTALGQKLTSPDWHIRADAANIVGRMKLAMLAPLLVKTARDPELTVRVESINALAKLKYLEGLEVITAALDDENARLRATAALALGSMRDDRAAAPLVKALTSYDVALSALAAESLIKLASKAAIPPLIKTLAARNWRARAQAARVLSYIPAPEAITALVPLLSDKVAPVRYYTGQALSHLGEPAVLPILEAIRKDEKCRYAAAQILVTIGHPALEGLCSAVVHDPNEAVRITAATILAEIGDARAIEPLMTTLDDERFMVRESGARALGKMGAGALNPLLNALTTPKMPQKRAIAALALKLLGIADAQVPLVAALSDKDNVVRAYAVEALGVVGDATVLPLLENLAQKERIDTVRAAARTAINQIKSRP